MFSRLKKINKNQKGFTLIELIMVIAITALIIGVIAVSIFQLYKVHASTSNRMLAVRQVQNAGHWISRDVQMTQQEPVIVNDGGQLESITLAWQEFGTTDANDATLHEVTYTLLVNGDLKRSHSVNGGDPTETLVAQYIESGETSCVWDDDADKLVLTVTASVGTWPKVENETRVYEVIPRPDSVS